MDKFSFDEDFQNQVIRLIFQKWDFLIVSVETIRPEYFENKVLIWFFQTIVEHYHTYNSRPDMVTMKNELLKACANKSIKKEEIAVYTEVYQNLDNFVESEDYIRDHVITFCKREAFKRAFMKGVPLLHSDDPDWDGIMALVDEARSVGDDSSNLGLRFFEEVDERVRARSAGDDEVRIPIGIQGLDNAINGGVKPGKTVIWMGSTGTGKSLALAHVGKRAVVGGFKVVYYSLELGQEEIAERYDSSFSKVPMMDLEESPAKVINSIKKWGARYGPNLVIKSYPPGQATVGTIRSHMTMLINEGFNPDLILVDYMDLLKPLRAYDSEYAELGRTAVDLAGLGVEFAVRLHTATQVNRAGANSDVVGLDHVADSYKKLFIADLVISICRTKEEKNENLARLFIAKSRLGPANIEIPIATAYHRMAFYDPRGLDSLTPAGADPEVTKPKVKRRKKKDEN
ncbi:MAG: hypothetical protein L3J47_00315 [Sulfurovum sp.]|nr:hypothetical protein [Sulfurovum sp.]